MYIDAQFRAAKLPARSPEPRFSGRPLASSLVVHALIAASLVVLAHRTILRTPEETPPIPMVFLPPEPAPVAPAPPQQAAPPAPQPPPPAKIEQPPPPVPQVAPLPPPPVLQESRPVPKPEIQRPARLRRERHEPRMERRPVERRVLPRREPREVREPPPIPQTEEPLTEPAPVRRSVPPAIESGPVIPPRPLSAAAGNRPPDYPSSLQARGVQGLVLLRVSVTADGRAALVSVMRSSGSDRLDESAASAVRGWRFIPATRGGRPIPGVAEVPVNFQLSG